MKVKADKAAIRKERIKQGKTRINNKEDKTYSEICHLKRCAAPVIVGWSTYKFKFRKMKLASTDLNN